MNKMRESVTSQSVLHDRDAFTAFLRIRNKQGLGSSAHFLPGVGS